MFWNRKQSPRPATKSQRTKQRVRPLAFETLEQRENPVSLASGFSLGDTGEFGGNVAVDAAGNTYISGLFSKTVDFDPTHNNPNAILTSSISGGSVSFVAKYDASGAFVWVTPVSTGGFNGAGILLDQNPQNPGLVVGGYFYGTQKFGSFTLTSSGMQDAYFAKLDMSTGAVQWVNQIGGPYDSDSPSGMAVDGEGNIYTTTNIFIDWSSYHDVFLTKFTKDGDTVWEKQIGGSNDNDNHSLALDHAGNIVIGGDFQGTMDFNPEPNIAYNLSSGGRSVQPNIAGYVAKYTQSTGAFVWADTFLPGARSNSYLNSILIDSGNNVYAVGDFSGTVDFNPDKKGTYNVSGGSDSYVTKLDSQGKFVWERTYVGDSNLNMGGAAIDSSDNLFLVGTFRGTVDLDPGAGTFYVTSTINSTAISDGLKSSQDILITKLTSSGNFVWGLSFGGEGDDTITGLTVDSAGTVFVIGTFFGQVNFNPDPLGTPFNLTANPGTGIFFIKLTQ